MGIDNYVNKRIIAFNEKTKEREYWLNKLSGELAKTAFPYDRHPAGSENEAQTISFSIDPPLAPQLLKVSNNSDYRLFMVLLAGLTSLLNKYSGSKDILVGAPIYKQETHGEFLNTVLVLRNHIRDNMTFKDLILEVKQTLSEAAEHQAFPIEVLPEQLNITGDGSGFPLFDVAILLENIHKRDYIQHIPSNIVFSLRRNEDALEGQVEYNPSLYDQHTIQRFVRHYTLLLKRALADISIELPRLEVLEEKEKEHFLFDYNRTGAPRPAGQTVVRPFLEQVEKNPGGTAVESDRETITYNELDVTSNGLANYLFKEKHIRPGDRVGILMDRSPQLVAAVLGVLKAGGSYVPIEPSLPEERIKYILGDSGVRVVLSQSRYIKTLNRLQWECPQMNTYLCMDSSDIYAEEESKSDLMSETLWDYVAETATDEITRGGWISSYTGEPFSKKEMDEYGGNVLKKLTPLLHKDMRVLEIGCASGLTMYRVAPMVAYYHGIDLSAVTIEKNKELVREKGIENIQLSCLPAHRIHEIREGNFDLIIINSVIQSFHGHNYLRNVMRQAVALMNPRGRIFAGDVMDHHLKDALTESLRTFKQENSGKNYTTKTDWSTELFVYRGFFEDLSVDIPEITGVEFSGKIHTVENELTRYRYDALLTIGEAGKKTGAGQTKHKYQEDMTAIEAFAHEEPLCQAAPEEPAYIIYTSGTTAKPKGVMVEHRSLSNYIDWAARTYVKDGCGNFPLFTSISFDLTITSIFVPLVTGNSVVVYEADDDKELLIERVIGDNKVHVVKLTPSHMKIIREMDLSGLKSRVHSFIAGGEDLDSRLAEDIYRKFAGNVRIYNEYGPTEATVGCMIYCYEGQETLRKSVAIGSPAANTQIYLLDRNLTPVPTGVTGEMYVSGHGVARGYLNRPVLTAEKFIPNPFVPGAVMYHTGDLALRLPDGGLEFAGRIDQQVKVRGYRIELGEIEAKLKKYDRSVEKDEAIFDVNKADITRIKSCTRCGMPANYPDIGFDGDGVCNICRDYDTYKDKARTYFRAIPDFSQLVQDAGNTGKYDCLVLYSGGKDSSYVLYRLVEMGYNVLAFTFDNGFISDQAFENIRRITSALNVDCIIRKTPKMNEIFVESLKTDHDVCNGCFKGVNTLGTQIAMENGINVIVSGMSRGQILDIKLHGFFQLGVFDEGEIEKDLLAFRKKYHSHENRTSALLGVDIPDSQLEKIQFVDFFRYENKSSIDVLEYLKTRDKFWRLPEDTGFCSTNCIINDVGIYVHLKDTGYHNYAAQLSWDCRLGIATPEKVRRELTFNADLAKVNSILHEIGYLSGQDMDFTPVKDAVVLAREDKNGDKTLCAYVESPVEIEETFLREFLALHLPAYMIPSYFIHMEKLPITPNGKVDRKALPAPWDMALKRSAKYTAPTTELQKTLVEIWEKVLGRGGIGINDNFFRIGGDSIKSIQIIARLNKAGYKINMKELFKYPVIADLEPRIKKLEQIAQQGTVTGEIPLSPIQKQFFTTPRITHNHYNQAVMFHAREGFDEKAIEGVFKKILEHHDALRMTYKTDDRTGQVQQVNHGTGHPFSLEVHDLGNSENSVRELTATAEQIQASINLEEGPLMKLALFRLDDGDRLLIVIHHLVVDGLSWRILFEDIPALYRQYMEGKQLELPLKTDSFKTWSARLSEYADSPAFLKEKTYWAALESVNVPAFEPDFPDARNYPGDTGSLAFQLDTEETTALLTSVHEAFGTDTNDILLAALGLAIKKTHGHRRVLVALEGHGREELFDDVNISRTIGWFTSLYPVMLESLYEKDPGLQIKTVKESLRKIPNKGIGYGILKYLTGSRHTGEIEFKLSPRISFNYLGQFDADVENAEQVAFKMAKEPTGAIQDPGEQRQYELDVSAMVAGGHMGVAISYSSARFKEETAANLRDRFKEELQKLIAFCNAQKKRAFTPSDFTYNGLSMNGLDRLLRRYPSIEDLYALSPMQEGMLYHSLNDPVSTAYFEQVSYRLHGQLNISLVEKTLNQLKNRHEVLRTAFVYRDLERPVQLVLKDRSIDFYYEDIRSIADPGKKEIYIKEFKEKDKHRSFDLENDLLLRVSLLQPEDSQYEFTWSFHHILMDGWCAAIINSELFEIYDSLLENRTYQLPPVVPYRTYIQWLDRQDRDVSNDYWKNYLAAYDEAVSIPKTRLSGGEDDDYKLEEIYLTLDEEKTARINDIGARNHVTVNVLTQAVWGIILGKYNGKSDMVFGAVVSGRPAQVEGVESMVGLFINSIPVRVRFGRDTPFTGLLQKIQEDAIAGEPHHYHSLAEIQAASSLKQNLIDHIFIFDNFPVAQQIEGYENKDNTPRDNRPLLGISNIEAFEQTHYDFTLTLALDEKLNLKFQYNANIYDRDFVEDIARHFTLILDQIIGNVNIEIGRLTLLSEEDKSRILDHFNDTDADYPTDKTVTRLFEEQVEKHPDNIAVTGPAPEEQEPGTLTYRELDQKAGQLARMLQEKGIAPGAITAVMTQRSMEMMIAIYGILKAGSAYLPIDPNYPAERIDFILKDSSAAMVLTTDDLDADIPAARSPQPAAARVGTANLAYVIYTSGTTGKPKGTMIEHHSLVNRLNWMQKQYTLDETDTILHKTPFTFDVSVWEIFWWATVGANVCLLPPGGEKEPGVIAGTIRERGVTVMHFVPSMLSGFLTHLESNEPEIEKLTGLKRVICSGEALTVSQVERFHTLVGSRHATRLTNLYGPTEATIDVSYFDCPTGETPGKIPIGKPVDNTRLYIMDENLQLQPVGVAGELCIGGVQLARGYLNRPELTGEKFVDYRSHRSYNKLYKTGDLARWLPGGNIEYLGRIDHQVKIRGFRIELGEIENRLSQHKQVKETVVIDKVSSRDNSHRFLCAYIVPGNGTSLSLPELRDFLAQTLPEYMIPAHFIPVEEIPLTPNGKIDRHALPEPEIQTGADYVAPRNELEAKLALLWEKVLEIEQVGVKDNYFHLGGDSIKAIRLLSIINASLDTQLKVADLTAHGTIERLSQHIRIDKAHIGSEVLDAVRDEIEELKLRVLAELGQTGNIEDIYPMSDIEKGMVFHSLKNSHEAVYHDQFPYHLKISGFDLERFRHALTMLVKKHSILRTGFNLDELGEPVQIVYKTIENDLRYEDLSELKETQQTAHIAQYMMEDRKQPFKPGLPPLWRIRVFSLGGSNICVLLIFHHAILDGWSAAAFATELNNVYRKLDEEPEFQPGILKSTYKEFVVHQALEKRSPEKIRYWSEQLDEYKRLNFAGLLSTPPQGPKEIKRYSKILGRQYLAQLRETARKHDVNTKHLVFAAYIYMLNMLSFDNDVVAGLATDNRPIAEDAEKVLGCFLNTVPVRVITPDNITWAEYIRLVDQKLLEVAEYNQLSLYEIVRIVGTDTREDNPIFDTLLNFVDFHIYREAVVEESEQEDTTDFSVDSYENTNTFLDFTVSTTFDRLSINLSYTTSVLSHQDVTRMGEYFERTLNKFINEPEELASKTGILPPEEKENVLFAFNDTKTGYSRHKTVHQLFEEQVEKTPGNIAVTDNETSLTYNELNEKANRLARELRKKGVGPNRFVAVVMDRLNEMIVAVMAIIKAGGAYVPLEPYLPDARIVTSISSLNAEWLLTNQQQRQRVDRLLENLPQLKHIYCLDQIDETIAKHSPQNPEPAATAEDIAYVIFTSGTTGVPKGVVEQHRPVVNIIQWVNHTCRVNPADKLLFVVSLSFDLSVYDIFGILAAGGAIRVASNDDVKSPERLLEIIHDEGITFWDSAPAALQQLVPLIREIGDTRHYQTKSKLRLVFLSGDWIPVPMPDILRTAFEGLEVMALGGGTEATIWSNYYPIGEVDPDWKSIPYGKPTWNAKYYIMDKNLEPAPIMVPGDLYIGGECLAAGYINDLDLTARKFLPNPFSPGERIYRTGDMARWFPDGNMEFLGRLDNQVKIRGYRIELGEIESQMLNHDRISETIVIAKGEAKGDRFLVAYYVSDNPFTQPELTDYLSKTLPPYMIPPHFVKLDKVPLTANGKVNRKALPEPDAAASHARYEPPRDETDKKLVQIWANLLDIEEEKIGINDNFFDLGGHSLNSVMMAAKIRKEMNAEIPINKIFEAPTINKISKFISSRQYVSEPVVVFNSPETPGKNVFMFPPAIGYGITYIRLSRELEDYTVYSFNFIEEENRLETYTRLITKYQPNGPYTLFGWSAGGILVFQVAAELEKQGFGVPNIILADSFWHEKEMQISAEDDEKFLDRINNQLDTLGISFLKDEVANKIKQYEEFYSKMPPLETVHANLHMLLSQQYKNTPMLNSWNEFITGETIAYQGQGVHDEMFIPGALEENARIIRNILAQIFKQT